MPSSSALISLESVLIVSSRSAIAFPRSETVSSRFFKSSSVLSIIFSQYSFFSSSDFCSSPSNNTMSSIIFKTFSKLTFFPLRASEIRFKRKSPFSVCNSDNALAFTDCSVDFNCSNEGVGKVFLKSSKASSSFKSLMVSAIANNSSARTLQRTSHSSSLVLQFFSKSLRKAASSTKDLVVSSKSSFSVASCTPKLPILAILFSTDLVKALISLVLAPISPLKSLIAASSSAVAVARLFCMVSVISFRMPTI
mmetsp:Transcript_44364/g.70248  ORF Transcript_44364/g.70248 Transcript_44364/m.70248 type:complete len:252 (+) Transcript_44364:143-898(+)